MALLFVLVGSHGFMHIVQNNRELWADSLFQIWTRFGEGWPVPIAILTLWKVNTDHGERMQSLRAFALALILTLVVSQGLKLVFSESPRPWSVHPAVPDFPALVKRYYKSFPSGHTSFAVAIAATWSTVAPKKYRFPIGMFLLALGVAFSRIYLHMHWLHDVLAGGLLGLGCSYIALRWVGYR